MNLIQGLERNARNNAGKAAIVYQYKVYTYKQYNEEVNQIANALVAYGVKKGDKIAIMMKNSAEFAFVFYATLKAGAIAVPVNFRLTSKEAGYIISHSDSILVFADSDLSETVHKAVGGNQQVKLQIVSGRAKSVNQKLLSEFVSRNKENPNIEVFESDDAEIMYTSGTTGKPKGVLLDHHRVLHVALGTTIMFKMGSEDNLIHLAPLFHCAQLNLFLVTGTMLGCTNVIRQDFNPMQTLKDIEEYKISLFFAVPTMYNFLLQVPNRNQYDLSSVLRCGYGAAPMPISVLTQAMDMFGTDQFFNMCGQTEGGPGGVFLLPEYHKTNLGASGRADYRNDAKVVNDNGEDVQPGEVGEFILKSESVMKGYYKNPEETSEALRNGWLYTGDLATKDGDGFITLVDRKKDMIISGGENVYSTEVEHVLYKHPDILEAAVIGIPHEMWGETVAAVVVAKEGRSINIDALQQFCREDLAGYKIPRAFYEIDQLPRNTSGKILKYQLREKYQETIMK
ncbi:class I adenylate-forming enzyme family protein [Cytobacillus purgationiresistens]|uniref:Feruloyl-CoA synthase n=1 Tax=Cytobacillus purgationiresistens TaxID=863449 RepID=A0ABU0AG86_9BACI|nr:long-chain fatty acid--CoA ligase [Cytobacillus purgationiresistens]MDQ0269797.1 feruloyl-CoA synthase [Cytobacillus purgationiresistens]